MLRHPFENALGRWNGPIYRRFPPYTGISFSHPIAHELFDLSCLLSPLAIYVNYRIFLGSRPLLFRPSFSDTVTTVACVFVPQANQQSTMYDCNWTKYNIQLVKPIRNDVYVSLQTININLIINILIYGKLQITAIVPTRWKLL